MKKSKALLFGLAAFASLTLVLMGYMLFWGYFDQGHFEIEQIQRSSKQVAVLAKRWDDQALGGLTYFVVIDNHLPSTEELKHEYHSDAVVFDAMSDRLRLRWDGQKRLLVECEGPYLRQEFINAERHQKGDIAIVYSNISPETAQTFRPK
jgi:hypothetical protein